MLYVDLSSEQSCEVDIVILILKTQKLNSEIAQSYSASQASQVAQVVKMHHTMAFITTTISVHTQVQVSTDKLSKKCNIKIF